MLNSSCRGVRMANDFSRYLAENSRFQSYLYSYPHKTAYRHFAEKIDLATLWQAERRNALFLYTHIPFCELKCAYCNLFTISKPQAELVERYLVQLSNEAEVLREVLGTFHFANYAVGGGTPSILSLPQLDSLFDIYTNVMGVDLQAVPGSFEVSPDTLDAEKIRYLAGRGIQRLSIGIQSFIEAEARAMGRVQPQAETDALLDGIANAGFPVFNLDLIYGIAGQTEESWLASLRRAVSFAPDELFLYPLYVRPLTALHRKTVALATHADIRRRLYALACDFLQARGYVQDSMRLFRRVASAPARSTEYSCQEDGMIGLGVNARSYTRDVHYSTEYAVAKANVAAIVQQYVDKPRAAFAQADYGIRLSEDDRRRRYLIKSILKAQGLERTHYREVFGTDAGSDFPDLDTLLQLGLAQQEGNFLRLTAEGMAHSDLIGHWFISPEVGHKMQEYVPR
jgi:oxygen-independent coproporphyrinogen III oxidase